MTRVSRSRILALFRTTCYVLFLLLLGNASSWADDPHALRLESVRVEPSGGQEEVLVRRHLPLRVGQAITSDVLVESQRYLEDLGHFASIEMYTVRGRERGAVILVIEAELDRRWRFETGVGSEPLRGWFMTFPGVRKSSPFGRGGLFRAGLRSGLRTGGPLAQLIIPSVVVQDYDLLLELELTNNQWMFLHDGQMYEQQIRRFRLHTGLRKKPLDTLSMTLWAGISGVDPENRIRGAEGNDDLPLSAIFDETPKDSGCVDTLLEVLWDHRDRFRSWQAGYWAGLRLKSSYDVDNEKPFWAAEFDYRAARPLFERHAFAFRTHAVATSEDTPYPLRPTVGGPRSLRGFTLAGLSGSLGARGLWLTTAELRFAVAGKDRHRPRVLTTVFLDAGQHWGASGKLQDLSASTGYGLQFQIPWLQILNLEVAYPLTENFSDNPVMVHASLGRSF